MIGTLVCAVLLPLSGMFRMLSLQPATGAAAVVGTLLLTPLHLRHVWLGTRGLRPPRGVAGLVVMAVGVAALMPVIGAEWCGSLYLLGASTLIVLRPPWSPVVAVVLGVLALVLPVLFGQPGRGWYFLFGYLMYGLGLAALVYVVVVLGRQRAAQTALAEYAAVQERVHVDAELRRTVGADLAGLIARIDAAGAAAALGDAARTSGELERVVEGSRRTLAGVRRLARAYGRPTLRSELDVAVALLAAGGIEATVVGSVDDADVADAETSRTLRAGVTELLRAPDAATHYVIEHRRDGPTRLRFTAGPVPG
ncbi:hypothetical protein WEH80_26435 [Actinomycetes bacterium KLBMP 9759]